ncbi:MAG: Zn-dependent hydrolase [Clostridium sp.]|nr:Zn-dependent hydrolase [Clostridium sp.]
MFIKWFGDSCFCFQDSLGHKILIDPLDKINSFKSNIITFSQKNQTYFSYLHSENKNILLDSVDSFNNNYVTIKSYSSFSDNANGIKRGKNIIHTYIIDNITICHLGHLGHILTDDSIKNIGKVDILLIPIDGNITLDYTTSSKILNKISPKITIPMCYKSSYNDYYSNTLKDFLLSNKLKSKFYFDILDTNLVLNNNSSNIIILKKLYK